MTSAFLTLTKGQGHTTRSKVTDVEVSAFSECFLFFFFFFPRFLAGAKCAKYQKMKRIDQTRHSIFVKAVTTGTVTVTVTALGLVLGSLIEMSVEERFPEDAKPVTYLTVK